jgi:Xaa-Pro aminopeptidase
VRHLLTVPLALALSTSVLLPQIPQQEYVQRRAALMRDMEDGALVAFGAREPVHDYETFTQASSFLYLTGIREPNAALVMVKRGSSVAGTIFVEPKDPAREVWSGIRLGVEQARTRTGLSARPTPELRPLLDSLGRAGTPLHVVGSFGTQGALTLDGQLLASLRQRWPRIEVEDVTSLVEQLRAHKSAAELTLLRRAIEITVAAQREAMGVLEPGMNEFELQALIEYTFRRNGADRPGFATIVGSGPNSTILHYNANDRFTAAGDVVVMDIGASYRGYTADVTRTIPVSGTFTPEQRAIYQIVRDAQAAAERQLRVGVPAQAMEDSAQAVMAAGLARLGLIESPDATYDCPGAQQTGCPQLRLFYLHGLGHGIGLDVHDPARYYYEPQRIQAGDAFTIEPGIYVRENLLEILPDTPRNRALMERIRPGVERYKNIGVRIEDDYFITERGAEWVSRAPREIDEVEALMRAPYAGPAARKADVVEDYRRMVEP